MGQAKRNREAADRVSVDLSIFTDPNVRIAVREALARKGSAWLQKFQGDEGAGATPVAGRGTATAGNLPSAPAPGELQEVGR